MSAQMGRRAKQEKQETASDTADKVVVAVKASREIPKTALVWALTHVVQPGDCITLLVVVYSPSSGRKFWGFARFSGGCASAQKFNTGTSTEQKYEIKDSCSQMILQLQDVYDPSKVNVKVKIISGSSSGAVAEEAKRSQANWVILDKQLKHEEKHCMEELQCNIVVMKRSQPKVLRLNLVGTPRRGPRVDSALMPERLEVPVRNPENRNGSLNPTRGPTVTPISSPELGTPFTATEPGVSSASSSDPGTSPFVMSEESKKEESSGTKEKQDGEVSSSGTDSRGLPMSSASTRFQPWIPESHGMHWQNSQHLNELSQKPSDNAQVSTRAFLGTISEIDRETGIGTSSRRSDIDFNGNVREAISLSRSARAPPGPPPLCSICKHKAPVFGKPPKWFSYAELELATGGFSEANFLAEGGYGSVHRGVLLDGQAIAVKQHKLASSQGDREFCSEVEVLSCAQHRNVVMLIGFCIEDSRRLLVYEYICNGSLDYHLYGEDQEPLEWPARYKIAIGAARGLRYLHEECRVGCIIHRDMRPNNILLTHDFEPLVGDFGLARWQPDGDTGVETRVIGTFGYLAPEYAQIGQITDKADVYSFGVVLVELVTGRKAVDLSRPKGQQCLTEWARPLLEGYAIHELIDPHLGDRYSENEVYCMLRAASLCIRKDPHDRPRMSQVLRVLEGDSIMDTGYMSTPSYDVGIQSGRVSTDQQQHHFSGPLHVLGGDSIDKNYVSIPGCDVGNQSGQFSTEQQQHHYCGSLHALEGGSIMDTGYLSIPGHDLKNQSGRISTNQQQQRHYSGPLSVPESDSIMHSSYMSIPGCGHGNQNEEQQQQHCSGLLHALEGDSIKNTGHISAPGCDVSNQSERISTEQQQHHSSPLLEGKSVIDNDYMSTPGYDG